MYVGIRARQHAAMGNFLLEAEMGVTTSMRVHSERGYPSLCFSEGKLPEAAVLQQSRHRAALLRPNYSCCRSPGATLFGASRGKNCGVCACLASLLLFPRAVILCLFRDNFTGP